MNKLLNFILIILIMILSGCSSIGSQIDDMLLEKSEIFEDEDYQSYKNYEEEGNLTKEGYYSDGSIIASEMSNALIENSSSITFSHNNLLQIKYFTDESGNIQLDENRCYLTQGEALYARVEVSPETTSNLYEFAGFRIYGYENGKRLLIDTILPEEDGLILTISGEYIGADIAIEPIGKYSSRLISLHDYYIDDDGNEQELSNTWYLDQHEEHGTQIEISPISSYIISYEYDSDEYFYIDSEPESFYRNSEDGVVIFQKREPLDESNDYTVQLHKYISVSVESDQNRSVSVNSQTIQEVKAGTSLDISKLKYGDEVVLLTDKAWPLLEKYRELILQTIEPLSDGRYKYTLIVPQKEGGFVFDPNEYVFEHGTISFICFGEPVTGTQYLAVGSKITYEATGVEEGYWLPDGNHVIVVTDPENTRNQLNSIHFVASKKVKIDLEQPQFGGRIRYLVNGNEIKTDSLETTSGTVITMEFLPWEGWINHFNNGESFTVTEDIESVSKEELNYVNNAFTEDTNHMPELEITLDRSVGEAMEFGFMASGMEENVYRYEGGFFVKERTIVDGIKIGTEMGISYTIGNRALQSGTAVKVLVEKIDTKGNKTSEYHLIDDLTSVPEPIWIYNEDQQAVSKTWYKSIKITFSVVDVQEFSQPANISNATVVVKNTITLEPLKTGDILGLDEKVTISIMPMNGYYISGEDVNNDIFKQTMSFEDYQVDIHEIINAHPAQKYYQIVLDDNDPYGTCLYTLDGEIVSGKVSFKDQAKLTLEYSITIDGYRIDEAKGFLLELITNDQKDTQTITLTKSHDGQTINRETYGIEVIEED